MTGELRPIERDDGTLGDLTPLEIAEEQRWTHRIALASPTFPEESKQIIREHVAERHRALEEAGEHEAAAHYATTLEEHPEQSN
ncbi:hypothetical protein BVY00_02445 [bacterium G20]|nr:hypothetical protein BVY00_02445 [bacterium G20]